MGRIYYLLNDINDVDSVSDKLHENGISNWQFHVLAKDEEGLYKHHLHSASFFQKRDIVHSGERGALFGGAIGLYLALFTSPWTMATPALLISIIVVFTSVGVMIGGILGNKHENYKISRFHDDLESGKYLVMLDVKKNQYALAISLMKHEFPSLKIQGKDSTFSNPFKTGAWIYKTAS